MIAGLGNQYNWGDTYHVCKYSTLKANKSSHCYVFKAFVVTSPALGDSSCFSYLLLQTTPEAYNSQTTMFIIHPGFCHLGRAWQRRLVIALCGISWSRLNGWGLAGVTLRVSPAWVIGSCCRLASRFLCQLCHLGGRFWDEVRIASSILGKGGVVPMKDKSRRRPSCTEWLQAMM